MYVAVAWNFYYTYTVHDIALKLNNIHVITTLLATSLFSGSLQFFSESLALARHTLVSCMYCSIQVPAIEKPRMVTQSPIRFSSVT